MLVNRSKKASKTFLYTVVFTFFPSPSSSKMWRADLPSCQIAPHILTEIEPFLDTDIWGFFLNLCSGVLKTQKLLNGALLDTIISFEDIEFSRSPDVNYFFAKSNQTFAQSPFNAIKLLTLWFFNFLVFKNWAIVDI